MVASTDRPRTRAALPAAEDLQKPSLARLLATWALVCLAFWFVLAYHSRDETLTYLSFGLLLTLVIAASLYHRFPQASAAALVTGVAATAIVVAGPGGRPAALMFVAVPIAAAAALLPPVTALLAGVAAAAAVLSARPPGADAGLLAILYVVTGASSFAVIQPQRQLLAITWQRGLDAMRLAGRLHDKQGELNRTIKALDLSYQLLQKTNRELALAQREAEELRDLRHRFATNLSHELRTPLNVVLGFANLIYRNPQLYGVDQWQGILLRDLAQVQRNARYLSQLVDDVVDLARVDALAMPLRREPASVAHVIDEAVDAVASLARAKGLALTVSCAPELPEVVIDPLRIRQVLVNLLSNAVRFTDEGSVTVEAGLNEDGIVVSVRDTGPGIAAAELPTIFDEFHQVGRPKSGGDTGKGLGLAIARRFVQLHGGRIWVDSEVGRGSDFHFTIPLADVATGRLRGGFTMPLPRLRRAHAILVISDDDSAALYLSRRLEGYDFVHCRTPVAAAELAGELTPVALLLDAGLGLDHSDVRRTFAEGDVPCPPLIECPLPSTGWIFGNADFAAVLTKPVDPDTLAATLDSVAGNGGQGRILIVDDDRGFVQLIARVIEAGGRGYDTDTAYSAEEALRKMRRAAPRCVLLDLVLPGMNGFQLLGEMRAEEGLKAVPAIALTAATPGEDHLVSGGASFSFSRGGAFRPGELAALLTAALQLTTGDAPLPGSDARP